MAEFPKPDYKFWDDMPELNELKVVCLWADYEPSLKASQSEKAQAIKRILTNARKEGRLHSVVERTDFVNAKSDYQVWYRRQDLINYANLDVHKPAFLFPETRIVPDAPAPLDNERTPNPDTLINETRPPDDASHKWKTINPSDPPPEQPWYTPARFFARELVKEDSNLILKKVLLADKVSTMLKNVGICKRGGKLPIEGSTILKALVKVNLK